MRLYGAFILACLLLWTCVVRAAEPVLLVGYNEHRTNLPGG